MIPIKKIYLLSIITIVSGLLSSCQDKPFIVDRLQIQSIGTDTLYTGKEYQLHVMTIPNGVSNPRLSWSVSDGHIAEIQYGGVLRPLNPGSLTVFVTSLQSDGKKVKANHNFTVLQSGIYFQNKAITINPQEPTTLKWHFLPKEYKPKEKVSFLSTDSTIVSVDQNGVVFGKQLGQATIKIRLGEPFSENFSEDQVLVTVASYDAPKYTLKGNTLYFEQTIPGLLPRIASNIPYLENIVLKGPINGTDFVYLIKNTNLKRLDLGQTYVVSGGLKYRYKPSPYEEEKEVEVKENDVPPYFFTQFKVKKLVVPQKLKSIITFGDAIESLIDTLEVPTGYKQIEFGQFNVNHLILPEGLKSLKVNIERLKKESTVYTMDNATKAICHEVLKLPSTLEQCYLSGVFEKELVLPASIQDLILGNELSTVSFEKTTNNAFNKRLFPYSMQENTFLPIKINKLILPDGLVTLGDNCFASNLKNQGEMSPENNSTIDEIIFPKTLRRIGMNAFFRLNCNKPVVFNDGLEIVGIQSFQYSTLRSVTFPESIKKIETQAFAFTPKLESVYSLSSTPPHLGKFVFYRNRKQGRISVLYVPKNALKAYENSDWAQYFYTIKPIN